MACSACVSASAVGVLCDGAKVKLETAERNRQPSRWMPRVWGYASGMCGVQHKFAANAVMMMAVTCIGMEIVS